MQSMYVRLHSDNCRRLGTCSDSVGGEGDESGEGGEGAAWGGGRGGKVAIGVGGEGRVVGLVGVVRAVRARGAWTCIGSLERLLFTQCKQSVRRRAGQQ